MTCTAACLCRCQQIGCGCREVLSATRRTAPIPKPPSGVTALCNCTRTVPAQHVRTDANRVVTVIFCPSCDTNGGR